MTPTPDELMDDYDEECIGQPKYGCDRPTAAWKVLETEGKLVTLEATTVSR